MKAKVIRRGLLAVVTAAAVAAGVAFVTAGTADAQTGGTPDGANHPNVGIIVFYDEADGLRYRCSATLISPTVVLTAAHCTSGTAGKTLVSFVSEVSQTAPPPGVT